MKRFLLIFIISFLSYSAYAINWYDVHPKNGKYASIDIDSIKQSGNYYFYNIKIFDENKSKYSVLTIQSGVKSSLSSKINEYTLDKYNFLNGDYDHIEDKKTKSLQPVQYGSIVSECYSKVKAIMISKYLKIEI